MSYSWNKRVLNRPLAEGPNTRQNYTQVQILDVTREENGAAGATRVLVGEGMQSSLPELSDGTVVRWIHIRTDDMDFDLLINFALTYQEFTKEDRVSVYNLLRQFRKDQQRDSNHGKYFEPACLQQTQTFEGMELGNSPQLISLPYVAFGDISSVSSTLLPLRSSLHPTRSLLQYHYRRESGISTASRDSEQTSRKLTGPGSSEIVLVKNLWILVLNKSTMITVAPTNGDQLWSDLNLTSKFIPQRSRTGDLNLWETLDLFADNLQQKIVLAVEELEDALSYQRWIKKFLPASLINKAEIKFSESEEPLGGFWGFLFLLTNPEWIYRLQHRFSTLEGFLTGNKARFENLKTAEMSAVSEETDLQSESLYLSLYESIEIYIEAFTKVRGRSIIPILFPSNKEILCSLWIDVKHQSQLFLWKLSAMDLNAQVMTATGLLEIEQRHDIPTEVEHLVALMVRSLVPGDSTELASSRIGDIYSQYIARMQLRIQQSPSKDHSGNIYQVVEELEIIRSIVESQRRVVTEMVKIFHEQESNSNTNEQKPQYTEVLTETLQKLRLFQSDLDEYQNSCSRAAAMAAQQQADTRMEYFTKTLLALTIITMIFLPLIFVSSLFGMNVVDIREMEAGQWIFWVSALSVTFIVGSLALVVAFFGESWVKGVRGTDGHKGSWQKGSQIYGVKED